VSLFPKSTYRTVTLPSLSTCW